MQAAASSNVQSSGVQGSTCKEGPAHAAAQYIGSLARLAFLLLRLQMSPRCCYCPQLELPTLKCPASAHMSRPRPGIERCISQECRARPRLAECMHELTSHIILQLLHTMRSVLMFHHGILPTSAPTLKPLFEAVMSPTYNTLFRKRSMVFGTVLACQEEPRSGHGPRTAASRVASRPAVEPDPECRVSVDTLANSIPLSAAFTAQGQDSKATM